jgi:3-oxoacyl-[acyl-carrier protein] reductase
MGEPSMDLGIAGRTALVCAASKGLGRGCATALAREGVNVFINARDKERLERTAKEIEQETNVKVVAVPGDVTKAKDRARVLEACPSPDILITNAGGPPVGSFRDFDRETWLNALDLCMLGPIEMIKATVDDMISRRFGRIVCITSSATKGAVPGFDLSNGARTGLTGFVAGVARETVKYNVTVNNMLPGFLETDRLVEGFKSLAELQNITPEEARQDRLKSIPAGRFGSVEEFGAACAFLCSVHSGYITGHNLLLDGGRYPGTF